MSLHEPHRSPARRIDDLQLLQGLLTQRLYVPEHDRQLLHALLAETPRQPRARSRASRRSARRLRATGAVLALSGALALTLSSPLMTAVAASPQSSSWVAVADRAATPIKAVAISDQTSDVLLRALLNRAAAPIKAVAIADQTSDVLLRALLNRAATPIQAVAVADQTTAQPDGALAQAQLTAGEILLIPAAQIATDAIDAAPVGSAEQQGTSSNYVVKPGDTLSGIAQAYYGNGALWPTIYNANKDKIKDPHWIYPDQQFVIPAVPQPITAVATPNTVTTTGLIPRPQAAQGRITQYTVQPGDTLSGIAYYAYGHADWRGIFQANGGQIANPDLIYPGQVLAIP
jgi:nucleoid-associated protein YgaU